MWFTGPRRHRQDDAGDAHLPPTRWRPTGTVRDLLAAAPAGDAARDVPRGLRAQPEPAAGHAVRASTCCTSTTSAPSRPARGCSSSSTRSSTRATRTAAAIIVTTNLIGTGDPSGDAELREQIGDRTVSRLYEMCGDPLPMFGDDRRLDKQFDLPEPVQASVHSESLLRRRHGTRIGLATGGHRRLIPRHGRHRDRGRPMGR